MTACMKLKPPSRTPSAYGVLSMNAETGAMMKFEMYVGVTLSVENPQAALDALEEAEARH